MDAQTGSDRDLRIGSGDYSERVDGFVLVHGGCHASWCWERLTPLLDRPALAVDLPGRDGDPANFDVISLQDWVASLTEQVAAFGPRRLALVAHSLGGISMPAAASQLSERVGALVFVSAVVPPEGGTAQEAFHVGRELFAADGGFHPPPEEAARHSLCNDMERELAESVLRRLIPEPGRPMREPVSRKGLPKVRTIYVRPSRDNGVPWAMQEQMIANLGGAEQIVVDAGHNVIYSRPALIADLLNQL